MFYLAGPCDTEHRTFMTQIAKYLREKGAEIYCPWELKIENAWDYSQEDWARLVFEADIAAINACEAIIMISEGRKSTAGVNWENGYAYAIGKPVHIIQITEEPTSLMTYCGCTSFINIPKGQGNLTSALRWILEHPTEENHNKCRTVLT